MNKDIYEENERNIRVFGLEAQKKLFESEVLIINITPMMSELCKNIILSGAGLCLFDDNSKIEQNNTENIFFFNNTDIGKKKVEILREKIKTFKENWIINIIIDINEINNRKIKYAVIDLSDGQFNNDIKKQIESIMINNKSIIYYIKIENDKGIFFNNILENKFLVENKTDNEARFVKDEKIIDHMDLSDDDSINNENKKENNKENENENKANDEKKNMKIVELNNEEEEKEKEILKDDDYAYLAMEEKIKKIEGLIPKNMKKNEEIVIKDAFRAINNQNQNNDLSKRNPLNCLTNYVIGGIVCHEIINCISRKKNPRTNIYYYDSFNGTGKFLNELYDKALDN